MFNRQLRIMQRVCKVFDKSCSSLIVGAGPCARPLLGYIRHWRGTEPRPTVEKRKGSIEN